MNYDIIIDFARQKNVRRWNGRKTLSEFNLLEHSARVTHLCRVLMQDTGLSNDIKLQVLEYALLHDYPEVWLNDTPSPIKAKYPQLDGLLKSIEGEILAPLNVSSDNLIKWIVKLADILDCLYEALIELKLGVECDEFVSVVQNSGFILSESKAKYGIESDKEYVKQIMYNAYMISGFLLESLKRKT